MTGVCWTTLKKSILDIFGQPEFGDFGHFPGSSLRSRPSAYPGPDSISSLRSRPSAYPFGLRQYHWPRSCVGRQVPLCWFCASSSFSTLSSPFPSELVFMMIIFCQLIFFCNKNRIRSLSCFTINCAGLLYLQESTQLDTLFEINTTASRLQRNCADLVGSAQKSPRQI